MADGNGEVTDEVALELGKLVLTWGRLEGLVEVLILNGSGMTATVGSEVLDGLRGSTIDKVLEALLLTEPEGDERTAALEWVKKLRGVRARRNHWLHSPLASQNQGGEQHDVVINHKKVARQGGYYDRFSAEAIRIDRAAASELMRAVGDMPSRFLSGAMMIAEDERREGIFVTKSKTGK